MRSGLGGRHIGRVRGSEFRRIKPQVTLGPDSLVPLRELREELARSFSDIGLEHRDINKTADVRISAGNCNDPDRDYWPILQIQDAFRCRDIVGETRQRFLDDGDAITVFFKDVMDRTPT